MDAWKAYSIGDTGQLRPLGFIHATRNGKELPDTRMRPPRDSDSLTYQIGETYEAHCYSQSFYVASPILNAHLRRKEKWGKCNCGFYALRSLDELVRYLTTHCLPNRTPGIAIGPVLLEGWVAKGAKGYRAQKMRVLPPELVITQTRDYYEPLSHAIKWKPVAEYHYDLVRNHWNEARAISWVEWKAKEETWTLARSKKLSRSIPRSSQLKNLSPLQRSALINLEQWIKETFDEDPDS